MRGKWAAIRAHSRRHILEQHRIKKMDKKWDFRRRKIKCVSICNQMRYELAGQLFADFFVII
jgi:hypothetical protein